MTSTTVRPAAAGVHHVTDRFRALFHVTGTADPGLLPRLIDPVVKLGLVPSRLFASAEDGDGSVVTVDMRLGGVPLVEAERVALALRRVVGVAQVLAVIEPEA
ncbi:MAG: hypothetical protein R3D27_06945 [Hyphomicrobiaceae bacterium]